MGVPFFIVGHVQRHGALLPSGDGSTCWSHSFVSYLTGSSMTSSLTPVAEKYGPLSKLFSPLSLRDGFPVVRGGPLRPFPSLGSRISESDVPSSSESAWSGGSSFSILGTLLACPLPSRSESSLSDCL